MAKRKKKLGALGPTSAWLRVPVGERAKLKADIIDGVKKSRRLFKGLTAKDGFDLRHPERWSTAKLKKARNLNTITRTLENKPFVLKTPTTKKQRKSLQSITGLTRKDQKSYPIFNVMPDEKVRFQKGAVIHVREYEDKKKSIRRNFLFADYLEDDEEMPETFEDMIELTERMLPDMPKAMGGREVFYGLFTTPQGVIGNLGSKDKVLDLLQRYYVKYDTPVMQASHKGFAEAVIGWYMTGTNRQVQKQEKEKTEYRKFWKNEKLQFTKKVKSNRCTAISREWKRCKLQKGHEGKHQFTRRK